MSVIAEISVPADEFALGRIMGLSGDETVELESLVPAGERAAPYFWVYDASIDPFAERLRAHSAVETVELVDSYEDRALFRFTWNAEDDAFFRTVQGVDAYVLNATGTADSWRFELRFPSHEAMSTFQERCFDRDVAFEVIRVYKPECPDLGPWYGLTERQREAIVLAVESGYYDIPRGCTTVELAEQLGISDQAVTERLRRAIVTLVGNTLLTSSRS